MRQVDDLIKSSASLENYMDWLILDKLGCTNKEYNSHRQLFDRLVNIEFIWINPMDENRAIDGLDLREDFTYETGCFLDKSSGLMPKCSFLEMLVALSCRCERQLMRKLDGVDRSCKWFFEFLDNLGLLNFTNSKWVSGKTDQIIFEIVDKFMYGEYKNNGSGGLFPVKKSGINQKKEDIWKQLNTYLNEKYPLEGALQLRYDQIVAAIEALEDRMTNMEVAYDRLDMIKVEEEINETS